MRRTRTRRWIVLACLLSWAWAGTANAQETRTDAVPAAEAPAAEPGRARPSEQATDVKTDAARRLVSAAQEAFVLIRVWYRKDPQAIADLSACGRDLDGVMAEYFDMKRPEEHAGVTIAPGRILMVEDGVDDRLIERIEAVAPDGASVEARRAALLTDTPGILLQVPEEQAGRFPVLETRPAGELDLSATLRTAKIVRFDDELRISTGTAEATVPYAPGREDVRFTASTHSLSDRYGGRPGGTPVLIGDEEGRPLGVSLFHEIDPAENVAIWKGASLREAERLDWSELQATRASVQRSLAASVREVLIKLRNEGSNGDYRSSRYERFGYGEDNGGAERALFGVAIGDKRILVPAPLSRETAARIERIDLRVDGGRKRLEFVGAYRDFAAFVVELPDGGLTPVGMAPEDPAWMKPFFSAAMRKALGGVSVVCVVNRIVGKSRGYEGAWHWDPRTDPKSGMLLLDRQGRLAGLYVRYRRADEEQRRLEGRRRYYFRDEAEARIFPLSELREALRQPETSLDPRIAVKKPREAKRRAWLGVEFVGVDRDLAEQLDVEKPTRDGQIGFILNAVYPDSPAERMDLRIGDIVLKIEVPGREAPIEMNPERARDDGYFYPSWMEGDEASGPAPVAWKNRRNHLTALLDTIGVGRGITLHVHRPDADGGGTRRLEYAIEMAPPDLSSARKWQNRKLGLTVRNLTYEVRYGLELPEDAPGVILVGLEDGSPAGTARIFPNEIITHVDETPLESVVQMRDLVAGAAESGREKVRLTVLRTGRSRFADLDVSTYDPDDDEGLDEE